MLKKIVKKITLGTLALTCVFGCIGTFTACDEGNPEAKITLEFLGEEYTMTYELHEDKTPKTVEHFMWLVENNYYDGMCIHDYQDSNGKWYTGAYKFDEGRLDFEEYRQFILNSEDPSSFPHSVWEDEKQETPLYTLFGEFANNNYYVGNKSNSGAINPKFGSLSMYYNDKSNVETQIPKIWVEQDGEIVRRAYNENSATSMFCIWLKSASVQSSYCTFATLTGGAGDLEDLQAAIAEYVEDLSEGETFTTKTKMQKDPEDRFIGSQNLTVEYSVPNEPIIIKSAWISKY
ncbi:MAG: peptidylprolyl isomerase [Clostridia bacterium]|nr:peptidylprolyl isomerase [Clostridia bacterium]